MTCLLALDPVTLSRAQFALTIMFHYLFPPLTIGMGVVLVFLEAQYLCKREPIYETAAKAGTGSVPSSTCWRRPPSRSPRWRHAWDYGFFGSSLLATILFGVTVGNAMTGIPLDERGVFVGSPLDMIKPYPFLVGFLAVSLFAMHGALYLYLNVPNGGLHQKMGRWVWHAWGVFLVAYVLTTIYTLMAVPRAVAHFHDWPWAFVLVAINVLAVANIPRTVFADRPGQAFVSSCITILALVSLFSIALWPNLVAASNDPRHSLTVFNAASSPKTLGIMLVIALIGMPLVLTYTAAVYWTFRRRVELGEHSY